jgi:2,3-bisphosphoglycerate-independent phosphoglycerate mutase
MAENIIKKVVLVIMDGWGYAPSWGGNAISSARTPNFDFFWKNYPHTLLHASGSYVGLTRNERGNSEVGHLNLGAGRIVFQDKTYIDQQLKIDKLKDNFAIQTLIKKIQKENGNIHLMGLVSDGGIHSHIDHLIVLLKFFAQNSFFKDRVYVHVFTDGRDSPTHEAINTLSKLIKTMKDLGIGKIATVSGRYYAMDRDNNWDRTKMVYDVITDGSGNVASSALGAISGAYARNESDEFVSATVIKKDNKPVGTVKDNDGLIFFNFRSDRARQLTMSFTKKNFKYFNRKTIINNLFFINLVPYGIESDFGIEGIYSMFDQTGQFQGLSETISKNNLSQLHIAETEKYAHVTYFFNGGIEKPNSLEDRIMVLSPKVNTYDQYPQMSAEQITNRLISNSKKNNYSFVLVNYANADMVGHTGNYRATIVACEMVDRQIGKLVNVLSDEQTIFIVTADHGNAEQMTNPKTGKPDTEHTSNLVPCIIIKPRWYNMDDLKTNMKLANIAPTILDMLGIEKSQDMQEGLF